MTDWDDFGQYGDNVVEWYRRRSVWAAGAIGVGVGFLLTLVF